MAYVRLLIMAYVIDFQLILDAFGKAFLAFCLDLGAFPERANNNPLVLLVPFCNYVPCTVLPSVVCCPAATVQVAGPRFSVSRPRSTPYGAHHFIGQIHQHETTAFKRAKDV